MFDTRRIGNSTRLIDQYVQELFTKGEIQVFDHFDTQESHESLFKRVLNRLGFEHPYVFSKMKVIYMQRRIIYDDTIQI